MAPQTTAPYRPLQDNNRRRLYPLVTLAAQSYSPLILATNGNLYGTTLYGGTFNGGTIFQYTPTSKAFKTLFNFKTEYSPWGPLMQGVDGALYGTTTPAAPVPVARYKITTAGVYKVLVNFVPAARMARVPTLVSFKAATSSSTA